MRREMTLALCLASISGIFAAVGAYDWLSSMADGANKHVEHSAQTPPMDVVKVVVAKEPLTFGTVLTPDKLRVADWPADSVPPGTFQTIDEIFDQQKTRTVLEAMREREAVLTGNITGPGQRASLSTMLRTGMKAVSVRVDDVVGVAGWVLPGDYVDVLMTTGKCSDGGEEGKTYKAPYTQLVVEKLRVLAIDQTADPRQDGAQVSRAVTLEANQLDAQKITLVANIATLSLMLRDPAAETGSVMRQRISSIDLNEDCGDKKVVASFEPTIGVAPTAASVPRIVVWRGTAAGIEQKEFETNPVRVSK